MGQYYMPTLIAEDGTVSTLYSHQYDNGLKLMEHSYIGNKFVNGVLTQLWKHPMKVAWIGDYSDGIGGDPYAFNADHLHLAVITQTFPLDKIGCDRRNCRASSLYRCPDWHGHGSYASVCHRASCWFSLLWRHAFCRRSIVLQPLFSPRSSVDVIIDMMCDLYCALALRRSDMIVEWIYRYAKRETVSRATLFKKVALAYNSEPRMFATGSKLPLYAKGAAPSGLQLGRSEERNGNRF